MSLGAVQAYEYAFNPQDGLDGLGQNIKPVAAGFLPILVTGATTNGSIDFSLSMQGCNDPLDPVFADWPELKRETGYFAVFALVSQYGMLNHAFEGAVASTTAE